MVNAKEIKITGIVQGVGFRPFICNTANKFNINGWVLNNSSGVIIHCQYNNEEDLNNFISQIKNNPPTLSKIITFTIKDTEYKNFNNFTIKESYKTDDPSIFVSPDVCTCEDCFNDILDKKNKRYYYPFTNCTNCGPRLSIIKEVPYDRKYTTMNEFTQCDSCNNEYNDMLNRRFHAQPNCCPNCGPSLSILDKSENDLTAEITSNYSFNSSQYNKSIIKFFQQSIMKGNIWSIKSLSGFHLCCSPYDKETIDKLRNRKNRPTKPFALMVKDIDTVKKYCYLSENEEKLLLDKSRPIVLLKKKETNYFPENIAPNNNLLGIMLPSTPLHILIMDNSPFDTLIMTSGNLSGLPLEYENKSSINNLSTIADYFLTNNRDIILPLDDSILRESINKKFIIRRSRGFVPLPIEYKNCSEILALGCDMKNTFSMSKNNHIYIGPYTGDLDNYETIERLKSNIKKYIKIFETKPKFISCDMHPNFETTRLAKEYSLPIIQVQHHHAHIVSCMIDNNYKDNVIGIAFDGTGYGDDNCIWGSEFLICNSKEYKRVGHLEYINFPKGDSALRDGSKIALSYLRSLITIDNNDEKNINQSEINTINTLLSTYYKDNYEILFKLLKNSNFTYKSSSMGRLFDGVSSLLGLCHQSSYEGEAAIILESILISSEMIEGYEFNLKEINNVYTLSPIEIIRCIIKDIEVKISLQEIALKFHCTIVNYIVKMCKILRKKYSINTIALSGGVFQNNFLMTNSYNKLISEGFQVLTHNEVPTNDSGISLGQIIIANEKIKKYPIT